MEERERQKKNGIERNLDKIMFAGDCGLGAGMVTELKMSLNGSTNARMDKRGGGGTVAEHPNALLYGDKVIENQEEPRRKAKKLGTYQSNQSNK